MPASREPMSEGQDNAGEKPQASPEQRSHAEAQPAARNEADRRSTQSESGTVAFGAVRGSAAPAERLSSVTAARGADATLSTGEGKRSPKQAGDKEATPNPMNEDDQDERSGGGIGATLALWGPLLLILFLIFIFWGERDDTTGAPAAPDETPQATPPAGGEEQGGVRPQAPSAVAEPNAGDVKLAPPGEAPRRTESARPATGAPGTESQASPSARAGAPAPSGLSARPPAGAQGRQALAIAPQARVPPASSGPAQSPRQDGTAPEASAAPWVEGDPGAFYWGPAPLAQTEPPEGFAPPAYAWPPPPPGGGAYPPPPPAPGYGPGWTPWGYAAPPHGMGAPGAGGYAYGPPPGYGPWHMPPPGYPPQSMGPWRWGYPPPPGYGGPGYVPPGYGGPEYAPPEDHGSDGGSTY